MGLDMYLKAKRAHWTSRFDGADLQDPSPFSEALKKVPVPQAFACKFPEVVECEAMYWRKANAIHNWFVQNVQDGEDDCGSYHVSRDKLKALHDTVREVLGDVDKADDLLPTQGGCFFGSTEYDEGYWQDLEDTDKRLTAILEIPEEELKHWSFEYQSSW
jgi:hypothetical protein